MSRGDVPASAVSLPWTFKSSYDTRKLVIIASLATPLESIIESESVFLLSSHS